MRDMRGRSSCIEEGTRKESGGMRGRRTSRRRRVAVEREWAGLWGDSGGTSHGP